MRTIAHVSDIHFGRTEPGRTEALLRAVHEAEPDLTVVSGDLTMRARSKEYCQAVAWLAQLPEPYVVIPGNHDIPQVNLLDRFITPFRRYQKFVQEDLEPTWEDDEIALICLNTVRRMRWHLNWGEGGISEDQADRAKRWFAEKSEKKLWIVVTHHPFLPPPEAPKTRVVGGARRAMDTFADARVDLLLAGHVHQAYSGGSIRYYPRVQRSIVVAVSNTSSSNRLRGEPNSFNVITYDPPRLGIQIRAWDGHRYDEGSVAWLEEGPETWEPVTIEDEAVIERQDDAGD